MRTGTWCPLHTGYEGASPAPRFSVIWLPTPYADADGDGRVTGSDAVAFFSRSGLPRDILAKIWGLSDVARRGFLDAAAFSKAIALVSIAQEGGAISQARGEQDRPVSAFRPA